MRTYKGDEAKQAAFLAHLLFSDNPMQELKEFNMAEHIKKKPKKPKK